LKKSTHDIFNGETDIFMYSKRPYYFNKIFINSHMQWSVARLWKKHHLPSKIFGTHYSVLEKRT